jgi:putative Ca2+/H+ antiporter (TMEM165/GDT1 family)
MDWKLISLSFAAVFLSELGDKSQLAAIALSGSSGSPWIVFWGTAGALLLTSCLGVMAGEATAQVLPTHVVKAIAAVGFVIIAIRLIWNGVRGFQAFEK